MTNKFGIRYSVDFFEDLDAITSYIKNAIVANRLIEKVEIAIEKRLENPISYEDRKSVV